MGCPLVTRTKVLVTLTSVLVPSGYDRRHPLPRCQLFSRQILPPSTNFLDFGPQNVISPEMAAIKSLNSNQKNILKPADKGSGIVLMIVQDYIFSANRQLFDTDFYERANPSGLDKATHLAENLLTAMRSDKDIDQKCCDYLWPDSPAPGRFYMLPKIHKGKLAPPGRPINSAIESQNF